jgi:UDP-N-acetylglucosamine pyrophosphorylase
MFKLGHTVPSDNMFIDNSTVFTVDDKCIKSFIKHKEEKRAFLCKKEDGSFIVVGLLAIDRDDKLVRVAIGNGEHMDVKEECMRFFHGPASLDLSRADLSLFRQFYPHL